MTPQSERWLLYRVRCHKDVMRLLIEDLAILGLSLNIVDELKETLIKNIKRKILPEENPPLKGGILGRDLLVTEGRSESKEVEVT